MRGKFAQTNYSASKAGNIALTKALAKELGKFNVNVNAVAPGMVMTEMAEKHPAGVPQRGGRARPCSGASPRPRTWPTWWRSSARTTRATSPAR